MTRAAPQTIKGAEKEPVFCRFGLRITRRRADDSNFIGRQNTLAKGILAVALPKRTAFLDGHAR